MRKLPLGLFILIFGFVIFGCANGSASSENSSSESESGGGGILYAGKAGSPSLSVMGRGVAEEADDFSIQIDYLVGRSTKSSFMGWGILNYGDGSKEHVIPITSQIEIGDLSSLGPKEGNVFCDYIGFDIQLLYKGSSIANFPESMFIKGETLDFYSNAGNKMDNGHEKAGWAPRSGWKDYKIIFNKYPLVPDLSWDKSDGAALFDDFVVIPFDGIDLNREFDLKFEWDTSILIDALEAAGTAGNYRFVGDRDQSYIKDFFKSFALRVIYKN
jgi:hypothetical protein